MLKPLKSKRRPTAAPLESIIISAILVPAIKPAWSVWIEDAWMLKIAIGIICAFAAGCLIAVPLGMIVEAEMSPAWAIPTAFILIAGICTVAWLFFMPN